MISSVGAHCERSVHERAGERQTFAQRDFHSRPPRCRARNAETAAYISVTFSGVTAP
jgi:hypothetical protein